MNRIFIFYILQFTVKCKIVKNDILKLFEQHKELSVREIVDNLGVSRQMVHHALGQLLDEGKVEKLGRPPKTVYRLNQHSDQLVAEKVSEAEEQFLKRHFLVITETGIKLEGVEAFQYWCKQRKLPVKKTIAEFIETKKV